MWPFDGNYVEGKIGELRSFVDGRKSYLMDADKLSSDQFIQIRREFNKRLLATVLGAELKDDNMSGIKPVPSRMELSKIIAIVQNFNNSMDKIENEFQLAVSKAKKLAEDSEDMEIQSRQSIMKMVTGSLVIIPDTIEEKEDLEDLLSMMVDSRISPEALLQFSALADKLRSDKIWKYWMIGIGVTLALVAIAGTIWYFTREKETDEPDNGNEDDAWGDDPYKDFEEWDKEEEEEAPTEEE